MTLLNHDSIDLIEISEKLNMRFELRHS